MGLLWGGEGKYGNEALGSEGECLEFLLSPGNTEKAMEHIALHLVGFLVEGKAYVCCDTCRVSMPTEMRFVRIFKENIYPYNQHCCFCSKLLVKGLPGFCDLYDAFEKEGS